MSAQRWWAQGPPAMTAKSNLPATIQQAEIIPDLALRAVEHQCGSNGFGSGLAVANAANSGGHLMPHRTSGNRIVSWSADLVETDDADPLPPVALQQSRDDSLAVIITISLSLGRFRCGAGLFVRLRGPRLQSHDLEAGCGPQPRHAGAAQCRPAIRRYSITQLQCIVSRPVVCRGAPQFGGVRCRVGVEVAAGDVERRG